MYDLIKDRTTYVLYYVYRDLKEVEIAWIKIMFLQ